MAGGQVRVYAYRTRVRGTGEGDGLDGCTDGMSAGSREVDGG